ncbi:MAG: hypothetical protein CMJ24_10300 [Phycisphaerae bacterium]|jgi:hypothetical protein|nr:hypothetical protein [Phycisphaerae bacterium]|tara:strand:+ start:1022 stop:1900 length:879 start_codon:yes stop_codon:yes gene_type:complete
MNRRITDHINGTLVTACVMGTTIVFSSQTIGSGGCNGGGSSIEIHVETPCCGSVYDARDSDVLIRSVVWDDGSEFDQFIYASDVTEVEYEGSNNRIRVITAHESDVGDPGVFNIQDEDGDGSNISSEDRDSFADRILNAWNHDNINAYIHNRSRDRFSCIVEYEETIRDNSPLQDDIGELIVFEVSGNSWVKIEAIDEDGSVMGNAVTIGNYQHVYPDRIYTRKYSNTGTPLCSSFEVFAVGLDLSELGVSEARRFRFSSAEQANGNGNLKPSIRVVGVRTSTVPTAAMVFD